MAGTMPTSPRAGGGEPVEQVRGVAQREVRAQAERREHRVGGVTGKRDPRGLPGRRGLEEPERDHEDRVEVDARDQGSRGGVPAFDRGQHRVAEHGRRASRPLGRRRDHRPGRHAAADHDIVVDRLECHVGGDRGRRVTRALPGAVDRDQQPRALAVRGDDHALEQVRRQLAGQFGGQGRTPEDAKPADACVDDRGAGEPLPADRRADAVGAHEHVTLGRAAVGECHRHAVRRLLVPGDGVAGVEHLAQPGAEDRAQRPAVDTGVRPHPLVRRAQVGLRAQLVELVIQDDRFPPFIRPARGLGVQLEQVRRQAAPERLAAVGVHVEVVADLAAVVGIALEELAGVPVLDQPLGQGQAAEATAGDEDVQRLVSQVISFPSSPVMVRSPGRVSPSRSRGRSSTAGCRGPRSTARRGCGARRCPRSPPRCCRRAAGRTRTGWAVPRPRPRSCRW